MPPTFQGSYEEALRRLQQILQQLERMDFPLEQLQGLTSEAKELLEFCQTKLRNITEQADKILLYKDTE
jgi:exodeoxyribonuclease VII small subunit